MADTVNVDTLEQMVRDGLLFQNARAGTALSDLAARARENEETEILLDAWKRDSEAYKDRWTAEQAKRRAAEADRDRILLARENAYERLGRAEADRDRLARRVAELEAALREIAADNDEVLHQFGDARRIARAALAGDGGGA